MPLGPKDFSSSLAGSGLHSSLTDLLPTYYKVTSRVEDRQCQSSALQLHIRARVSERRYKCSPLHADGTSLSANSSKQISYPVDLLGGKHPNC